MRSIVINRFLLFITFFVFGVILVATASEAKINTDSMVAAWFFDEGNGKTASDSTGNGHDGAIEAGPKWVKGRFGKALEFDGTDDWVSVPHSKNLGFSAGKSFTITVHYKGSKVGGSLVGKNYEDKSQALPW